MTLLNSTKGSPINLRLTRNLVRSIKRGHPWIFADALRELPDAPAGSHAILFDNKKNRPIARGFYDAGSPIAFRVCTADPAEKLDDGWAERQLSRAVALRQILFGAQTTGYRLLNGEGDGLPGLVCDVYSETAVLQFDGAGPGEFWDFQGIARWIAQNLSLTRVYLKEQSRYGTGSRPIFGELATSEITFLENNVRFSVDIVHGQKTGFFLDQRENRQEIRSVAAERRVLNLFGYTGGFSVYAGLGGSQHVDTVDLAAPALEMAKRNWYINDLPPANHTTTKADAFEFLAEAAQQNRQWDLVIVDPPSFAPTKQSVKKAVSAYKKLINAAAAVTTNNGLLAAASCSSHIDLPTFLNACEEGISQARRRATLLSLSSQPADHPSPLPFSEFRYLKFALMRVE